MRYTVVLEPVDQAIPAHVRIRAALKGFLRLHGLRAVEVTEVTGGTLPTRQQLPPDQRPLLPTLPPRPPAPAPRRAAPAAPRIRRPAPAAAPAPLPHLDADSLRILEALAAGAEIRDLSGLQIHPGGQRVTPPQVARLERAGLVIKLQGLFRSHRWVITPAGRAALASARQEVTR